MLTSGPFTLQIGQVLTQVSPYSGVPSAVACQVQNVSGFAISVQAGGEPYSIPPYTCATVPVDEPTSALVITPVTQLFSVGAVTLAWLLERDKPPVPDGPIWSGSVGVPQKLLLSDPTALPILVNIDPSYRTIVLVVAPGVGNVPCRVVVLGNVSAQTYIDTGSITNTAPTRYVAHVDTAIDPQLLVAYVLGSATPAKLWLVAELDAYDVFPDMSQVSTATPLPVSIPSAVPVTISPATVTALNDYDVRTDYQPVYSGTAPPGTAQSAPTWAIRKFAYDGSGRMTSMLNATGAWTNRAALVYS